MFSEVCLVTSTEVSFPIINKIQTDFIVCGNIYFMKFAAAIAANHRNLVGTIAAYHIQINHYHSLLKRFNRIFHVEFLTLEGPILPLKRRQKEYSSAA